MRWLLAFLAWVLSAVIVGPIMFVFVMILAGPHSSVLPSALQPLVLAAGWLVFLGAPVWVARQVWIRRAHRPESS